MLLQTGLTMTDRFSNRASALSGPASGGFAVEPHDSNIMPQVSRALYVGGAGTISMVLVSGDPLTLSNVPAGSVLPVRARQVLATGTTATAIAAFV